MAKKQKTPVKGKKANIDLSNLTREELLEELSRRAEPVEGADESVLVIGTICSYPEGDVVELLKEANTPDDLPNEKCQLRARMNGQRNYRMFFFKMSGDFEAMKRTLRTDPKKFANWVNECSSIKKIGL